MKKKNSFLLIFTLLFASAKLMCQTDIPDKEWQLSIGAGALIKSNLRVRDQYRRHNNSIIIMPVPFINGSFKRFSLGHQGLGYRILGNPYYAYLRLYLNREGDRYDGEGLPSKKEAWHTGLIAKLFLFSFEFSQDISNRHRGHVFRFGLSKRFLISEKFKLTPSFTLESLSSKFTNYYYGVNSNEATINFRTYLPGAALRPKLSFITHYDLPDNWALMMILGTKYLSRKISSSPTMNGKSFELSSLVGAHYQF